MEIKIEKFDDLGNGICKIDNKVCFVSRSLPGEIVNVKIIKENKKYTSAIINNIIKESPDRIKPICKYYLKCGGCNFLHTSCKLEQKFKIKRSLDFFLKCDNFYQTNYYNYRNKVNLHVKNGNLGFYGNKTNDLIKIDYCYLVNDNINKVIELLNSNKDHKFNGEVIIRQNSKGEIILVINGKYLYIDKIKNQDIITNLVYNDKVIKGNNFFIENILDYKFKVSYDSFFQVNRLGLKRIYQIITNFLEDKNINTALDLYSGTSVLGILLSKYSKKVISVEVNSSATFDAYQNIKLNNIKNLEIINDKVENIIARFSNIDLIIIDPARRGLDNKTIDYLININPQYIIYIACSISSLKRDLKDILTTYDLDNLYVVDMFPRTNNVETVALLRRKCFENNNI